MLECTAGICNREGFHAGNSFGKRWRSHGEKRLTQRWGMIKLPTVLKKFVEQEGHPQIMGNVWIRIQDESQEPSPHVLLISGEPLLLLLLSGRPCTWAERRCVLTAPTNAAATGGGASVGAGQGAGHQSNAEANSPNGRAQPEGRWPGSLGS